VPALDAARAVHAWSAVRPLYDPKARADGTDTRLRSRGFTILDHARTDNVEGIVSIVGGKLAIFRLMAEKTADLVCERLGIDERCRTADTPID
jgi:glycerol-3-phosphate dehydrogenase